MGMAPVVHSLFTGCTYEKILLLPFPLNEIVVRIDPLSAFFLLIVYAGSVLTALYSIDYLKGYSQKRQFNLLYLSFNLLVLSMTLLPSMKNIFAFLIVWEAMSLSSFFAILFENEKSETRSSAVEYFIYMHIGFLMIMAGFLILSKISLSNDILSFRTALNSQGILPCVGFLLLFFGFGIKAGFVPFHSWLPKAHPASVSSVSGFMSGIMLKMGIYGILRFALMIDFPTFAVAGTVIAVSSVTALTGILYAMFEKDIKKLLAYSSIENMGIIGIGIGMMLAGKAFSNPAVMLLGLSGALLHSLNHSLFKPLLFFSSGSIYLKTHTRNISRMGGLLKLMPYTSSLFILGSAAISGLPLFGGFLSEFLIYLGAVKAVKSAGIASASTGLALTAVMAFVGVMAFVCFTKASGIMLLGNRRSEYHDAKDDMKSSVASMVLMFLPVLLVGIFPQYALRIIEKPLFMFLPSQSMNEYHAVVRTLTGVSSAAVSFALILMILIFIRTKVLKVREDKAERVWDCGYARSNSGAQYKSSSYTDPLKSITSMLVIEKGEGAEVSEYFPKKKSFEKEKGDIFDRYLISPSVSFITKVFDRFSGIQKGSTQQYLLLGMLFLVISLLVLIMGKL